MRVAARWLVVIPFKWSSDETSLGTHLAMYELWIGTSLQAMVSTTAELTKEWKKVRHVKPILRYVDSAGNVYIIDWTEIEDVL